MFCYKINYFFFKRQLGMAWAVIYVILDVLWVSSVQISYVIISLVL